MLASLVSATVICIERDTCVCNGEELTEFLDTLVSRNLTNKQRRYQAYRCAARLLQYGQQQKLPPCIECKIREAFPEEENGGICVQI